MRYLRRSMLPKLLIACPLLCAAPALACDYPDEGNMPLRRAVTRVQMLPETRAWHRERLEDGALVTYELLLEETRTARGRCYWTVEALADGKPWRRFYVTPDGKSVLKQPLPR